MKKMQNTVQLIGNLGKDPDIINLEGENKLARLSLATNEIMINQKGEEVEETQWHNLVAFGKTAEIVEKFTRKGSKLAVEGKLTNRKYTDKSGVERFVNEIKVNEIILLDDKKEIHEE